MFLREDSFYGILKKIGVKILQNKPYGYYKWNECTW